MSQMELFREEPRLFNNTGGPRSRVRKEPVHSDLLVKSGAGEHLDSYCVIVPEKIGDCYEWLDELARSAGFRDITDADARIPRPDRHYTVETVDIPDIAERILPLMDLQRKSDLKRLLRNALVLARCNSTGYFPDAVPVFTLSRIDRHVRLYEFKLEIFYELD